jgi:hypothetical protein
VLAVVSLLAVVTIGLTITRVATIVLTTTGLSRDVARFQARSAFTGVGFTTTEAESVVNHPVRRRVIMWLVLVGNAGIVTTVTSLLLSFNDATGGQTLLRTAVIVLGLFGLWLLAGSRVVDRAVHRATEWALRRYTKLELRDYDQLLHVTEDYAVIELEVRAGDWLDGHSLEELALRQEGVIVLGVYRRGGREYVGVPKGDVRLCAGDVLVVYGDDERVARLVERPAGEAGWREHEQAVQGYRQQRRDRPGDAEVTP